MIVATTVLHFTRILHKYIFFLYYICWTSYQDSSLSPYILCLANKLHINCYCTKGKYGVYNWIGHILRRNCFLKGDAEGTVKGRVEVMK